MSEIIPIAKTFYTLKLLYFTEVRNLYFVVNSHKAAFHPQLHQQKFNLEASTSFICSL